MMNPADMRGDADEGAVVVGEVAPASLCATEHCANVEQVRGGQQTLTRGTRRVG